MTYSIKILKYAAQTVPGPQVFLQSHWREDFEFDFFIFLVQGNGITAVIDCGMDDPRPINAVIARGLGEKYLIRTTPAHDIATLLAGEGVRLEDVDFVGLTHFHSDHASNVALFPRARYLVSAVGWSALQALRTSIPDMVSDPVFPAAVIDFVDSVLADRVDLLPDGESPIPGVSIRHTGGHTADSAAFVVPTGEGRVVIPGDTIWTYANVERNDPVGLAVNIAECYTTMQWARDAADLVLPMHDPLVVQRHPGGLHA